MRMQAKKTGAAKRPKSKKRKPPFKQRAAAAIVRSVERRQQRKAKSTKPTRTRTAQQPANRRSAAQRPDAPRPAGQENARRGPTPQQRQARAVYLRRMRRRRKAMGIMLAVLLAGIVFLILSRTVLFKIQHIEVTNPADVQYTAEQIVAGSGVTIGYENLFRFDPDKAARSIEQHLPYVGQAQVTRDFPSTLCVTVTPTAATAAIAMETGYLLINEEGKMLEQTQTAPETIPVLRCSTDFETVLGRFLGTPENDRKATDQTLAAAQTLALYQKIYAGCQEAHLDDITLIDIRDVRAITLMYQNRLTLHLGTQDKLEIKLKTAAKTIAVEDDGTMRTGAINLTTVGYSYSRDTYPLQEGESSGETQTETTTELD